MKNVTSVLVSVFFVIALSSCATKPFTQDEANAAFEKVYGRYLSSLLLEDAQTYEVVAGDTLSAITRNFYGAGKGYYFPVIMLASNDVVLDPDLISPGMTLTIPDLEKNLDNPLTRSKIKDFLKEIADVYKRKGSSEVQQALINTANAL